MGTTLLLAPLAVIKTFRDLLGPEAASRHGQSTLPNGNQNPAVTNSEPVNGQSRLAAGKNGNSAISGDSTDCHGATPHSADEIRTGKRIELVTAGPGPTSDPAGLASAGISDPITGQPLSLDQAIRCGLIDTETEEFVDPKTGRRYSLGEAVSKGLIDPQLA